MSNIKSLIFILIAGAIGYLFILPNFEDLNKMMEEKNKYENSLETAQNIELKKSELLKQYEVIDDIDKDNIDKILPNSFNFISLLSQIDAIGSRHGITIGKSLFKEVGNSVGTSIGDAKPKNLYRSAIISFSFDSSYDQFNGFIKELETSLRILDIKSLKMEYKSKDLYSFTVEFETYWLN